MKLVLASKSERRKELLRWLGVKFKVKESGFDESGIEAESAELLVSTLALAKAQSVVEKLKTEWGMISPTMQSEKEAVPVKMDPVCVLGADTVVYFEGEVIGKPRDIDDARSILSRLRGKAHEVYSGVALTEVLTGKTKAVTEKTDVVFRDFSDEELEDYLATSESLGKAGAYMILGKARDLVEGVEGSVTNVTGLPLLRVVDLFGDFEIPVKVNVEDTIQRKTGFLS